MPIRLGKSPGGLYEKMTISRQQTSRERWRTSCSRIHWKTTILIRGTEGRAYLPSFLRPHRQVRVPQDHLLSLNDGLQDPVVERLRQVEVLHRHFCRAATFHSRSGQVQSSRRVCVCVRAHTFAHPPGFGISALEMLREDLVHALQAPADDIAGVSGTRPASKKNQIPLKEAALLKAFLLPSLGLSPLRRTDRLSGRYLRVSASLALGPCWVPDSSVWRRPTLFMAAETGEAATFSWMYLLPVRGVETFRAEA